MRLHTKSKNTKKRGAGCSLHSSFDLENSMGLACFENEVYLVYIRLDEIKWRGEVVKDLIVLLSNGTKISKLIEGIKRRKAVFLCFVWNFCLKEHR